jgi:predicted RNase H-like nuclease (RuvC/YqgF family)
MKNKLTLLVIIMSCSCRAALVDVPEKLTREELSAEIHKLEETIKSVEPKAEWFRKDMEDKVYESPFSKEAEYAASFYGNLIIALSNSRARLSRMKRELLEYEVQDVIN